jgi:hypothetical protein
LAFPFSLFLQIPRKTSTSVGRPTQQIINSIPKKRVASLLQCGVRKGKASNCSSLLSSVDYIWRYLLAILSSFAPFTACTCNADGNVLTGTLACFWKPQRKKGLQGSVETTGGKWGNPMAQYLGFFLLYPFLSSLSLYYQTPSVLSYGVVASCHSFLLYLFPFPSFTKLSSRYPPFLSLLIYQTTVHLRYKYLFHHSRCTRCVHCLSDEVTRHFDLLHIIIVRAKLIDASHQQRSHISSFRAKPGTRYQ